MLSSTRALAAEAWVRFRRFLEANVDRDNSSSNLSTSGPAMTCRGVHTTFGPQATAGDHAGHDGPGEGRGPGHGGEAQYIAVPIHHLYLEAAVSAFLLPYRLHAKEGHIALPK